MDQHAALVELLASSTEPEGIVVHAADGRAFFLKKEDMKRTAIKTDRLFSAFHAMQRQGPPRAASPKSPCSRAKAWLDSHSPNSAKWRRICLTYFEAC